MRVYVRVVGWCVGQALTGLGGMVLFFFMCDCIGGRQAGQLEESSEAPEIVGCCCCCRRAMCCLFEVCAAGDETTV